jgi:hypothetical protein
MIARSHPVIQLANRSPGHALFQEAAATAHHYTLMATSPSDGEERTWKHASQLLLKCSPIDPWMHDSSAVSMEKMRGIVW